MQVFAAFLSSLVLLAGCTSVRETEPPRTATEELLISTAVDHALDRLDLDIPAGTKIWIDASNFEGYDAKYAISDIRDDLLRRGALLMSDRKDADVIVEIRSGALSTDDKSMLIGVPAIALPVPFVGTTKTPEIALLKRAEEVGVAKLGITAYDARSGALAPYSLDEPTYGFSHRTEWAALLVISWTNSDLLPKDADH